MMMWGLNATQRICASFYAVKPYIKTRNTAAGVVLMDSVVKAVKLGYLPLLHCLS